MIIQSTKKQTFAKSIAPKVDSELGTSGGSLTDMWSNQKNREYQCSVEDLRYMKDNDGTIKSLYQILRMPIMANSWRIDVADDITPAQKKAAQEQADFVMKNLTLPPYKGGMTTSFRLVIARSLKAVLEGYSLAEKVFTINAEGKIVYRKIAFRDNLDITPLKDSKGGFAGYNQKYYDQDLKKFVDVTVPPEYCFMYTYNKDEDEIFGQSAFVAAYFHWDKKRRLYYLYEQAVEKGAMPPKMLEVQEGNKDDDNKKAANLGAIANFGIESAVLVPTGYKLNPYDSGKGRIDPMPGIDHHNAEMARSVLAQFIMLGTSDNTGSFALSKSHADLFMMALRGTMHELEEHFNSYLIPQLININFETPHFPEFRFNDMTDDTAEFIESIFIEIVKKEGAVSDSFIKGVVRQVAERLDIDIEELEKADTNEDDEEVDPELAPEERAVVAETEQIAKTALNGAQIASLLQIVTQIVTGQLPYDTGRAVIVASFPTLTDQEIDGILEPAKTFTPTALSRSKKKGNSFARGELAWRRDLTEAEENVNLAALEDKMITQEEKFLKAMKPQFDKVTAQALKDAEAIVEGGDLTKLDDLQLVGAEEYAATMVEQSLVTYNGTKQITSDDLEVKIPTTPAETKDYFKENAKSVTEKQFSDLLFMIKSSVSSEFHKGQFSAKTIHYAVEDMIDLLDEEFQGFFESKIGLTGSILVSQAINRARDDIFSTYKEDIAVYQYSAILDANTCPLCEELDGTIVDEAEYAVSQFQPPNHGGCRCIWIAIKNDQSTIPEATGFPDIDEATVKKNQTLNHKH